MRRRVIGTVLVLSSSKVLAGPVPMRPLTFTERVAATVAIERVYDAHRIWPKENRASRPPFERGFRGSSIGYGSSWVRPTASSV